MVQNKMINELLIVIFLFYLIFIIKLIRNNIYIYIYNFANKIKLKKIINLLYF